MAIAKKTAKKAVTKTAKRATTRSRSKAAAKPSLLMPVYSTACTDWEARIVAKETLTPCPPLFPTHAKLGMEIFKSLQIVDAGVTFGESRDWVMEFAEAVFGSYCDVEGHPAEGRRLIKTFFMLISKKNTKSTVAAGIMLTALLTNWRPEAEFLILAPTKEAADNCWKPIKAAVEADEELDALMKVQHIQRTLTHRETGATLKVVAADSGTVVGKKATGVLVDELHEFGYKKDAEDMLIEATGGLMSRPEGFVIYLSTQSSEPPAGVFKKELDYARGVRDGRIVDESYYPIIYEYPDHMLATKAYMDEAFWYVTNPNFGLTVDIPTLRSKFKKAVEGGEDSIQGILAKHFNVQIGLNLSANRWPAADFWEENVSKRVKTLDDLFDISEVITAGIDGGGLDDLLALNFTGRIRGTQKLATWSHLWVHEKVLDNRKEIAPRLKDFAKQGDLTIFSAPGQDTAELVAMMKRARDSDLLATLGVDPARLDSLKAGLTAGGFDLEDKEFFHTIRQGWSLYGAILYAERQLFEGNIEHAPQPIMDWCVGNSCCTLRGNAMLISKEVSGKAKIDGVMAWLNAMQLMAYNPAARQVGWDLSSMGVI